MSSNHVYLIVRGGDVVGGENNSIKFYPRRMRSPLHYHNKNSNIQITLLQVNTGKGSKH